MNASSKIQREHLEKLAFIYVRQSTPQGVRKNVVGGKRQEDVEQLAIDLGWPADQIVMVKSDTGLSGASTEHRVGYLEMLCAITEGRVGAVFSLESTRLGRDSADWHHLIKICHLTNTLIIDPDGIYDASDCNDSTLMKFKALMGDMELRLIAGRMHGARLELAKQGMLRMNLPTGFVHSEGSIVLDPDESVQAAVRLVFELFDKFKSALAVSTYFARNNILFPTRDQGKYKWGKLTEIRVGKMLHNPIYAGTWAYGRSRTVRKPSIAPSGQSEIKTLTVKVDREGWRFVKHDAHPAYISWSKFLENEEQLHRNRNRSIRKASDTGPRGASRSGVGLLQGLIICGKCGRRVWTVYNGRRRLYYICRTKEYGHRDCQSFPGKEIDVAVEELFLKIVEPVQLNLTIEAIEQVHREAESVDRQRFLQLEHARAAASHSRDRLLHIDYNNKYAFDCAQADLKEREEELMRLKRQFEDSGSTSLKRITSSEDEQLRSLIKRVRTIWRARTTSMVMKKNLLRCLISDVAVVRNEFRLEVVIRWKTENYSKLEVTLPRLGEHLRMPQEIVDFVKRLLTDKTDKEIAQALNNAGYLRKGKDFNRQTVMRIRISYKLGFRSSSKSRHARKLKRA